VSELPGMRGVHLFLDSVLIANLKTVHETPEEAYIVDGARYEVVSYLAITEDDTSPGFDVQVQLVAETS
jgi:hypothetical protein